MPEINAKEQDNNSSLTLLPINKKTIIAPKGSAKPLNKEYLKAFHLFPVE